jgi:haloalkane dehalogenase
MDLSGYAFRSNFVSVDGLDIHYLDEGDFHDPVILFLHGVPTWSYVFRNMFPGIIHAGYRVVCPDLPGFGYSAKPAERGFYSALNLVRILENFMGTLGLANVNLFAHDWGAILGMILLAREPALFSGIIVCNGLLPDPEMKLPFAFLLWRFFAAYSPWLPTGVIVNIGSLRHLNRLERAGYDLPFSKHGKKTAIRILPRMIPLKGPDRELAEESWKRLEKCQTPFLTIFSDGDPITRNAEKIIQERIPGAKDRHHIKVHAGHFLTEDASAELVAVAIEFYGKLHEKGM